MADVNALVDSLLSGAELRADTGGKPDIRGGLLDDLDLGAPNFVIARASLAPDPKDQIKRYAEHFDQPESEFGIVDGEIVRWVPDRNAFAKVVPTIGGQTGFVASIEAGIAQSAAGAGPAAPTITGSVAGAFMGPTPASIPVAGATAFLTDWARQALDKILAGEDAVPFFGAEYDYANSLGHAALVAGGEALGVVAVKAFTRNPMGIEVFDRVQARDMVDRMKWAVLNEEAKRRGITLTAGQITGLRSLMSKERQLIRYPETADMVVAAREEQRLTQVPRAYYAELAQIRGGPLVGREEAISGFREGADVVIQRAVSQRREAAREAYGAAYGAHPTLDSPLLRRIWDRDVMREAVAEARKIANARGELMGPIDAELGAYAREAAELGLMDYPTGGVASGLSLKTWDRVKRGLDEIWKRERDPVTGEFSAYGHAVIDLKKQMVKELDGLTGGAEGLYATARRGYGEGSDAVDVVLNGGIGMIQKMKGPDRVNMVSRVFTGGNLVPEEVARMRQMFIHAGQLDAWNKGLTLQLSKLLDDSVKSAGMTGNVPGQLYSRLGRDALQHDTIVAALGKSDTISWENFLEVLNAASRSLPEGSPTATDLMAGPGAISGPLKVAGRLLSPSSYFDAGNLAIQGLEKLRTPAARIQLAEYLLTDKGIKEIAKFRSLSSPTEKSILVLAQMFQHAGFIATGIREPDDFAPPIADTLPSQ